MDYSIKINEFEGPLDLLLHLIKESNMDILNIEINEITKQYLDYINKMEELNINVAASYLVMAAELMEIKSKSLLPVKEEETESEEEEEISKENLINKLLQYEQYKNMTPIFKELESNRQEIYIKSPEKISTYLDTSIKNEGDITLDNLVTAFEEFLKRKDHEKPLNTKITEKEYSVKARKNGIRNLLKQRKKVKFQELFEEKTKPYIVVTFLSILEMTKEHEITINQENNFLDITIEVKE